MGTPRIRWALLLALVLMSLPVATSNAQSSIDLQNCDLQVGIGEITHPMSALCGTLEVPEDWSDPTGHKLSLYLVVVPKRNPTSTLPPIFHLEGGPGASAVEQFVQAWNFAYYDLNENHDLILLDQRGTGKSNSLLCYEIFDHALSDLAEIRTPEQEKEIQLGRMEACLTRLSAEVDPANFTSEALARDTDAVRAALGYERIYLYGSSYGTWLAQFIIRMFPDRIAGAGLEGTVGPWDNPWIRIAQNYDAALDKIIALCSADPACAKAHPDLREKLTSILEGLDKLPPTVSGTSSLSGKSYPVVMTSERFLTALQVAINSGPSAGLVPQMISQAENRVFTLPASLVITSAELPISDGMYWSVVCSETVAFYTEAQISAAKTGGYYGASDRLIDQLVAGCQNWRSAELDSGDVAPPTTNTPILILTGSLDSQTPSVFARETAARFENSTLAVFPYQGHGVLPYSRCAQNLAAAFFADPGAVKRLDTSCAAHDLMPVFSGAFEVSFAEQPDPRSGRTYALPKGWTPRPSAAEGSLSFFFSPEGTSSIGIGRLNQEVDEEVLRRLEAELSAQYEGRISLQASLKTFGTLILQYAVTTPDELYTGALVVLGGSIAGGESVLMWYAAPGNSFSATFESILTRVLLSVMS